MRSRRVSLEPSGDAPLVTFVPAGVGAGVAPVVPAASVMIGEGLSGVVVAEVFLSLLFFGGAEACLGRCA